LNKDQRVVSVEPKKAAPLPQPINTANETINSEELVSFLYDGKSSFEYEFVLTWDLELPIYRERNFGFSVQVVDKYGNPVENSNKIPIAISLYTCENPPKYIDCNNAGNKILKGFAEKDLNKGVATFDKIQIKEVSSHFRNGWIFLVVHPKVNNKRNSTTFLEKDGVVIDPREIKPLVIEKVVVKAKKIKERDQPADQ